MDNNNQEILLKNQEKRLSAVENYMDFINNWKFKGKGSVGRKRLRCAIGRVANTLYETDDDEYHAVSKFYRGMWINCDKLFNEEDFNTLYNFALFILFFSSSIRSCSSLYSLFFG